jgi:hypothetical protein
MYIVLKSKGLKRNRHFINVEPNIGALSDIVLNSAVLLNDGPGAGGFSEGGPGAGDAMESEMEIALRISREEELERQRRVAAEAKKNEQSGQNPSEPVLASENKPAPQGTAMEEEKRPGDPEEDEEARLLEEAKKLSLDDSPEKMQQETGNPEDLEDENFDEDVLKTLGLDPGDGDKNKDKKDEKK